MTEHSTCYECEDTGYKEVKHPIPGITYCTCETGQRIRKEVRDRNERDWHAANDADLWNHPEHWPW